MSNQSYTSDGKRESDRKYKMKASKKGDYSFYGHRSNVDPSLDLYCKVCDVTSGSWTSCKQHMRGRRHAKNVDRQKRDPVSTGKLTHKLSSVTLASPKVKTPQVGTPKEKQGYSLRQRMKRGKEPLERDFFLRPSESHFNTNPINRKRKLEENTNDEKKNLVGKEPLERDFFLRPSESHFNPNPINRKRKLEEDTNDEKKNLVGLDYVLVIHKQGKSVFQCFLCDTCTMYQNSQQLTDHILGDEHQRAYVEQHDKGLIKIKRLKSKIPGRKGALEESIGQMLLNSNRKNKVEKNSLKRYVDPRRDTKSAKTFRKRPAMSFLRRTLEQVVNHNRKQDSKLRPSTDVPENRSSSTTPAPASLSPSPFRNLSPTSESSAIVLSDEEDNNPAVSTEAAIACVTELEKTLTTVDVFNLVILKLKNIKLPNELNLLKEVVEKSTKLIKHFEEDHSNATEQDPPLPLARELESTGSKGPMSSELKELQMEERPLQKDLPQNELDALEAVRKQLDIQKGGACQDLDKQKNHIPFINDVEEDNSAEVQNMAMENVDFINEDEVGEENVTENDVIFVKEIKTTEKIPSMNEVIQENSTENNAITLDWSEIQEICHFLKS